MSREDCIALANRIKDVYIKHSEVERVWDKLDSLRDSLNFGNLEREPRHVFIMGEGGVGKTEIVRQYKTKFPNRIDVENDGTQVDVTAVVYTKLPYPFTFKEFFRKILGGLGAVIPKGDPPVGQLKTRVEHLLKMQKVELVILDELNFISKTPRIQDEEGMELLKALADVGVCLACVGTPIINKMRTADPQYISRFEALTVNAFRFDDRFSDFLSKVEDFISPPYPIGLGSMDSGYPQLLYLWTQGNVRKLHRILEEAYRLLGVFRPDFVDLKKADLTIEVLKTAKDNVIGDDS